MKSKVLMAALVITLLMGVRGFASPCDQACVDPCGACDRSVKCDLFSGLKKLVNGVRLCNDCGPCDGVVACNPCDDAATCDPCGEVDCCQPKIELGKRLRNLFASNACNPCDVANDCNPCDNVSDCDPCGDVCNTGCCFAPRFSLRDMFKGFRLNRGCESDCGPCDNVSNCDPCGDARNCGPCDCAADCNPCDDVCGTHCGRHGHLLDLPRVSLKKLFDGFRVGRCNDGCNPCDEVRPCDNTCCR